MFFLDDILMAPISGMKFVFRTLQRVAEEQWLDDAPLKERLVELQALLDEGEIGEEDYLREEAEIMQGLRDIRERREALQKPSESP